MKSLIITALTAVTILAGILTFSAGLDTVADATATRNTQLEEIK